MTIQEAYKEALKRPISDLPNISLSCSTAGPYFYLKEDTSDGNICIVSGDDIALDWSAVTLNIDELMSDKWEIHVDSGEFK